MLSFGKHTTRSLVLETRAGTVRLRQIPLLKTQRLIHAAEWQISALMLCGSSDGVANVNMEHAERALSTFMRERYANLLRKIGNLCFNFIESDGGGICAATDAIPLPEPKPGAMR